MPRTDAVARHAPGEPHPRDAWRAVPGHVHSIESAGAVDGPGVRCVVFTAGCPMRCLYCHNPDTRQARHDQLTTAGDVLATIGRWSAFLRRAGGGLTVSGGEPLLQPHFVTAMFEGAHEHGIHTALDTSGCLGSHVSDAVVDALLDATDLVLLDVKAWEPETYTRVTSQPIEPTLAFARRLAERGVPVWLRYVLVPGLTDDPRDVGGVARFAATLGNVQRVDVLPFHQMGADKWRRLGIPYALADAVPPTAEQVAAAVGRFRDAGLQAA